MTDPPTTTAVLERGHPSQPLVAAVCDLYGACHLPAPTVLVAPSAPEFVRMVLALGRGWWPSWFLLLMLVAYVFVLGLVWDAMSQVLEHGLTRWIAIGLVLTAYLSVNVAVLITYPFGMRGSSPLFAADLMIRFAAPTVVAAGLGFAWGGGAVALAAAVLGCAAAGLVYIASVSTAPVRKRWAMRRAYRMPIPLRRVRPLHDVVGGRLRAAREGLPETSPMVAPRDHGRRERPEMVARLEAEGLRLDDLGWHALRPLLGAGSRQAEWFLLQHAIERVRNPDDLPHLLRAAWLVHSSTDAATFLKGVAVVLPAGAPLGAVPSPQTAPAWRRSQRSPYREAIAFVQTGFLPGLGVDAAWSDEWADRLLASCISKLRDAGLRHAAIRAMGMDRFMAAARLRPVQKDEAGELYLVGPPLDPLAFVRVTDATPGPEGTACLHWLSVPPHVATAREAVAWTFGVSEQEYAPAAET